MAKNKIYHARTKHIDVCFHRINKMVESEEIKLQKVHTDENTVDVLMTTVTIIKFKHCLDLANILA